MKNKRVKRISALMVSLLLISSLCCGCGKKEPTGYQVGVCQLVEHAALDAATKGFTDALQQELGDQVIIETNVADGSASGCADIVDQYVENKVDLIMANATPAMTSAANATGRIPIIATSITDYGTALNIRNWNGVTGINVTGTSDLAPVGELLKVIVEVVPDVECLGILYCSSESNSLYQVSSMETCLKQEGIAYQLYPIESVDRISEVASDAVTKCDAIYIPTDNMMASAADTLKPIFLNAKVPMFAGEEGLCSAGVATLSIDYYSIGYKAGMMAKDVLVDGKNPANMEICYSDEYTKKYNAKNAQALGLTIPDGYVEIDE